MPRTKREFEFTLVLKGLASVSDEVANALYEAGCDDATIAVCGGRVALTFGRSAASMKDAILGAVRDIRKAGVGADVWRVDDNNLVSQSDIARRIGRTRQMVHQYVTGARGRGDFPPPACQHPDSAPLWLWRDVARWLAENRLIGDEVVRDAEEIGIINTALDLKHQQESRPELVAEAMAAVGCA
ncbi:MAG: hypothetical protein DCC68_00405 [Planctomycetota bacterium]|nr:MAG: hypothetical protein DCC68_00405 [Planctomycetota bacterium]